MKCRADGGETCIFLQHWCGWGSFMGWKSPPPIPTTHFQICLTPSQIFGPSCGLPSSLLSHLQKPCWRLTAGNYSSGKDLNQKVIKRGHILLKWSKKLDLIKFVLKTTKSQTAALDWVCSIKCQRDEEVLNLKVVLVVAQPWIHAVFYEEPGKWSEQQNFIFYRNQKTNRGSRFHRWCKELHQTERNCAGQLVLMKWSHFVRRVVDMEPCRRRDFNANCK